MNEHYFWARTQYSDTYDRTVYERQKDLYKHIGTLDYQGSLRADLKVSLIHNFEEEAGGQPIASKHFPRGSNTDYALGQIRRWQQWHTD